MADLTADVIVQGDSAEHFVIMLTGTGSGDVAGDTATLVDASTLVGANGDERFKITDVRWSASTTSSAFPITLSWNADTDIPCLSLSGNGDWRNLSISNSAHDTAGCTGDLLLSVNGNNEFTIILHGKKVSGYTGITRLKGVGKPHK